VNVTGGPARIPRRVCVLSVHTSPLEQAGTGDAGGMNVYVVETATRMARRGVAVEIFTRATSSEQPPVAALAPGVLVRHVAAGPFEGLGKNDLPSQLCAFTAGVLRAEARHEPGYYDVIHSHYWLSGQVGWLARDRWGVPLVHSAHTLARVKNAALAEGDEPEPMVRVIGEDQVVAEADRLISNTEEEARQLVELYHADPQRTVTIPPGVDLGRFRPGSRVAARVQLGLPRDAVVLAFVGRIQPLKGPDGWWCS
jgi:D-inositol-3-phosphate glycosyltransferase